MVERILGLVSQPLVISMLIGLALGYDLRERRRRAIVRKDAIKNTQNNVYRGIGQRERSRDKIFRSPLSALLSG